MTGKRTHVVVIGGGYAGTLAANHLRLRPDVDITLVNPRPEVRRTDPAAPTRRGQPRRDRRLRHAAWRRHPVGRRQRQHDRHRHRRPCSSASGRKRCHYDYVIYAVGSTGAVPASVPGAAEFAYPIGNWSTRSVLRDTLDELHPDAPVTVVGAGLTGIETASELAEQGRKVTLVCGGQLAPSLSDGGRRIDRQVVRQARCDGAREGRCRRGPQGCGGASPTARCARAR